jgi:hypothetical protein
MNGFFLPMLRMGSSRRKQSRAIMQSFSRRDTDAEGMLSVCVVVHSCNPSYSAGRDRMISI